MLGGKGPLLLVGLMERVVRAKLMEVQRRDEAI